MLLVADMLFRLRRLPIFGLGHARIWVLLVVLVVIVVVSVINRNRRR